MDYTILTDSEETERRKSMPHATFRKRLLLILVWVGLGVTLAILGYQIAGWANPGRLPLKDFIAFWAAGRLNVTGGNPYDPEQLLSLQKEVGWTKDEPERIWNPPWALPLFMPFGMFSYPVGFALWGLMNLALVFFCADWIWRFYGGQPAFCWLSWVISLIFFPTLYVLLLGQTSTLVLLGIIGFLHFNKNQKAFLAGACTALVAIKPQLLW